MNEEQRSTEGSTTPLPTFPDAQGAAPVTTDMVRTALDDEYPIEREPESNSRD